MRIADSHSDYLGYSVLGAESGHVYDQGGVERLLQGGVALQNLAIWTPAEDPAPVECSRKQVAALRQMLNDHPEEVHLCTHPEDLDAPGIGVVLSVESGESMGCRTEFIGEFYSDGARMLSLTWNFENAFGSGCLSEGGLKRRGLEALKLMNSLHMALDVSHLNEQGFWEALDAFEEAPCASHSCVWELHANPRNLKKNQVEAIAERKGYIGLNFFPEFLAEGKASVEDIMRHLEALLRFGGEDTVGLGSDFCGISSVPAGLETAADFQRIPEALLRRGYSRTLAEKICYGNFARYILQFLKYDTDECI